MDEKEEYYQLAKKRESEFDEMHKKLGLFILDILNKNYQLERNINQVEENSLNIV